jgi:hypothetical protein
MSLSSHLRGRYNRRIKIQAGLGKNTRPYLKITKAKKKEIQKDR